MHQVMHRWTPTLPAWRAPPPGCWCAGPSPDRFPGETRAVHVQGWGAMTQDVAGIGQRPDVGLVALSVVLIAENIDPSTINQDFLRHNGIVDPDMKTEQPPVSTPVFSQVVFEGGLAVVALPDRFHFMQQGEALTEDIAVPDIVKRFLERVPHPAYKAVGINPAGFRPLDDASKGVATALIEGGRWMAFENVSPAVSLRAVYACEDRQITMDVRDFKKPESGGSELPGLLFEANIHRDIAETDQGQRSARLMSILSGWESDLSDFKNLVTKFNLGRTGS